MSTPVTEDSSLTRYTRRDVATELGVSIATVRRMEGRRLHPEVGPDGVHYFEVTEVRAIREERLRQPVTRHDDEGEIAARVFALLRRGADLREIVITAKVSPRVVRALYAEWLVTLQ